MRQSNSSNMVTIREMREQDTVRVHDIHTECLTISLTSHYSMTEINAWMYGRSPEGYWRYANAGETFRIAERNGEIIGYANWVDHELLSLFISPAHQRSGIGSRLFDFCDGESSITFVKATLGAVAFYKRFSFVEIGHSYDMKRGIQLPHVMMRR